MRNVPAILRQIETEVLVERIFVLAFEEALDESLVHDGDRRGGFVVGRGEASPRSTGMPKFCR